jgi:aspartate aminotransferase
MMISPSHRIDGFPATGVAELVSRVRKRNQQGLPVLDLSIGEPDFSPPPHVKEAAIRAVRDEDARYTALGGTVEVKNAVLHRIRSDFNVDLDPAEVLVSCGARHVLANFFLAVVNPGDEVLIPLPAWPTYTNQVLFAQGRPVYLETRPESGFFPAPEEIAAALTPKTRALVLNSPSNPGGKVIDPHRFSEIGKICKDRGICIVSDEVYRFFVYEKTHAGVFHEAVNLRESALFVDSLSKTWAMTGWRIGFGAGPPPLIRAMERVQSTGAAPPPAPAQRAAAAALAGPMDHLDTLLPRYRARRDRLSRRLSEISGLTHAPPEGAFYSFPDIRPVLGKSWKGRLIENDLDFCITLFEKTHTAILPGSAFGAPGRLRICFAREPAALNTGIERLAEFMTGLV